MRDDLAPLGAHRASQRGKIIPVKAIAFNKSRPIAIMMIIAATKPVRREASLRGGKIVPRAAAINQATRDQLASCRARSGWSACRSR
jgi:hypothetical protein